VANPDRAYLRRTTRPRAPRKSSLCPPCRSSGTRPSVSSAKSAGRHRPARPRRSRVASPGELHAVVSRGLRLRHG
jgi:hypothetical protein